MKRPFVDSGIAMSSPVTSGSAAAWGRYLDHHDRDVIARRTVLEGESRGDDRVRHRLCRPPG
jgi:hypothetical protein